MEHFPTPLRAGIVLSVEEASRIAEALVTIQQVAARVGLNLIDRLDIENGDADLEPCGDDEPVQENGDCQDVAWIEWATMRGASKRGPNIIPTENEDDEEDDPSEDDDQDRCTAGDDGCGSFYRDGVYWGAMADDDGALVPSYGVDQTAGPIWES